MLDIRKIRETPQILKNGLEKRGNPEKAKEIDEILEEDKQARLLKIEIDKIRKRRNELTEEIKTKGEKEISKFKEAKQLLVEIKDKEKLFNELKDRINKRVMLLPNLLHESVPIGKTEEDNEIVRIFGEKKAAKPESHADLLEKFDLVDLKRAAKVAGARFYYLKNELVLLELALLRFAIDELVKSGYIPIEPPFMIKRQAYKGVTALADFEDVIYKIENEDLYLIATSEHPIAAMHSGEIVEEKELPLKYVGISPCFRKEAGTHGKDTAGIFRVHQFNKIEQFIFCKPEDSWKLHEELLNNSENILKKLELPYRVVNICAGEIGTVAAKKYDIEVWMPAQNKYRETVSCSNCTDYQAIGLRIKYRKGAEKFYVHTLNSTAVASPRLLTAIMENYYNGKTIEVPKALQKYVDFKEIGGK